jgi:hypothetical protein
MTIERYQELLNDSSVIKIGDSDNIYFSSENGKLFITFSFYNRGLPGTNNSDISRRIELTVNHNAGFGENKPKLYNARNESLILVNSDDENTAMTFKLKINEEGGNVSVRLDEMPEEGYQLITAEERDGISTVVQ